MESLATYHHGLYDRERVRELSAGPASSIQVAEIARDGEVRMECSAAAEMLRRHEGLAAWTLSEEGWDCDDATERVASALSLRSETGVACGVTACMDDLKRVRITRGEWLELLELCLMRLGCNGSHGLAANIRLGRSDFLPWSAFVSRLILDDDISDIRPIDDTCSRAASSSVPSLATQCARLIVREESAFELSRTEIKLTRRSGGGVHFDAGKITVHDPRPAMALKEDRQRGLRVAQYTSEWPYRILRLAGLPRRVYQSLPSQGLGTGSLVWGGSLELCAELERRGSSWMHDKRVVELGAGQGAVSLCAALLGAGIVVSTDLAHPLYEDAGPVSCSAAAAALKNGQKVPSLLQLIERNRAENARFFLPIAAACDKDTITNADKGGSTAWCVVPLRWGEKAQMQAVMDLLPQGVCDLVLCSECAYDENSFALLLDTLKLIATPGLTEILMAHFARTQGGNKEAELRAFERAATAWGFLWKKLSVMNNITGITYDIHSLTI